jgi:DoxX-like family
MNATLWILQALLAMVFLAHGVFMLVPPASMLELMNASMSTAFRIFLGVAEVAAAIGLTVPAFTRVLPGLVPAAAFGLSVVMICATVFHIARGELMSAAITGVLLAMAALVAYMRWRVDPIRARPQNAARSEQAGDVAPRPALDRAKYGAPGRN